MPEPSYPNLTAEYEVRRIPIDTLARAANVTEELMRAVLEGSELLEQTEKIRICMEISRFSRIHGNDGKSISLEYLYAPVLGMMDSGKRKHYAKLIILERDANRVNDFYTALYQQYIQSGLADCMLEYTCLQTLKEYQWCKQFLEDSQEYCVSYAAYSYFREWTTSSIKAEGHLLKRIPKTKPRGLTATANNKNLHTDTPDKRREAIKRAVSDSVLKEVKHTAAK